jgi:hypothetical protein
VTTAARIAVLHRAAQLLLAADDGHVRAVGAAMAGWLAHGKGQRLEDALGIVGARGQRSPATQVRDGERNEALREAALRFQIGAAELSEAMQTYFAGAWLRDKTEDVCPPRYADRLESYLWHALKCRPWPVKTRRMQSVLAQSDLELTAERVFQEGLRGRLIGDGGKPHPREQEIS